MSHSFLCPPSNRRVLPSAAVRRLTAGLIGCAALLLASGCDDGTSPGVDVGPPSEIRAVSGSYVGGLAGASLEGGLAVLVVDSAGQPVPGVRVAWTTESTRIVLDAASSETGRDGIATMGVRLAATPGLDMVEFDIDTSRYPQSFAVYSAPVLFDVTALGPGSGGDFAPDVGLGFNLATDAGARPVRWIAGAVVEVEGLPAGEPRLAAATARGGLLVRTDGGDESRSFFVRDGVSTEIGTAGDGIRVDAVDVNANDEVVGGVYGAAYGGFLWDGAMTFIAPDSTSYWYAKAINDRGDILVSLGCHALVRHRDGTTDTIPFRPSEVLPDCIFPVDLSDAGAVVGTTGELYGRAFIWTPGSARTGLPGGWGRYSHGIAVNDAGHALTLAEMGALNGTEPHWVASGTGFPLEALVTDGRWDITVANDIDDDDRILAVGTHPDYVGDQVLLLTPVR